MSTLQHDYMLLAPGLARLIEWQEGRDLHIQIDSCAMRKALEGQILDLRFSVKSSWRIHKGRSSLEGCEVVGWAVYACSTDFRYKRGEHQILPPPTPERLP